MFQAQLQVRWGDSDRFGHVNNAKIVEYVQEARIQFLKYSAQQLNIPETDAAAVIRKIEIEYFATIVDDSGPLVVDITTLWVRNSSYAARHIVKDKNGVVCAIADVVLVALDLATAKSRKVSDLEREVLMAHLDREAAKP
jgi:acyl-CoA thioester hydrolase